MISIRKLQTFLFVTISLLYWLPSQAVPSWPIEEIAVYHKKEVINDSTFIYREDTVNGKVTKQWWINGKSTNEDAFLEAVLEAEKMVRRQERKKEAERRDYEQHEKFNTLLALNRKLLHGKMQQVQEGLKRIEAHQLQPFLLFSEQTYPSQEVFNKINQELLPQVQALLDADPYDHELSEFEALLAQLDDVPDKLQELFYETANNAIKRCDNTKMLKELIELVNQV